MKWIIAMIAMLLIGCGGTEPGWWICESDYVISVKHVYDDGSADGWIQVAPAGPWSPIWESEQWDVCSDWEMLPGDPWDGEGPPEWR